MGPILVLLHQELSGSVFRGDIIVDFRPVRVIIREGSVNLRKRDMAILGGNLLRRMTKLVISSDPHDAYAGPSDTGPSFTDLRPAFNQ
jgi:hypothetical protein